MHIKQTIGAQWIEAEEMRISDLVYSRLTAHIARNVTALHQGQLVLLGRTQGAHAIPASSSEPARAKHLPIFSFLIKHGNKFLHYNYVCALLNDLFGVQSRGGCQCAGPFSQELLGITQSANEEIELALLDKHEVLRPGKNSK